MRPLIKSNGEAGIYDNLENSEIKFYASAFNSPEANAQMTIRTTKIDFIFDVLSQRMWQIEFMLADFYKQSVIWDA